MAPFKKQSSSSSSISTSTSSSCSSTSSSNGSISTSSSRNGSSNNNSSSSDSDDSNSIMTQVEAKKESSNSSSSEESSSDPTKRKATNHLSKLVATKKPRIETKSQKMIEKKKSGTKQAAKLPLPSQKKPPPPPAKPPPPPSKKNPTKQKATNHLSKLVATKKPQIEKKSHKMIEKQKSAAKNKVEAGNHEPVTTRSTANCGTSTDDLLDNDDERHVFWSDKADNQFDFQYLANLGFPLKPLTQYNKGIRSAREVFECYGMTKNLTLSELQVLRAGWVRKLYSLFGNNHFLIRKHKAYFDLLNMAYKEVREALIANNPPIPTPSPRIRLTEVAITENDKNLIAITENYENKKKSSNTRRKQMTRPIELHHYKDQSVRDKFKKCAKEMNALHIQSTFVDKAKMDVSPQSKHFMFTYDEAVERPRYKKYGGNAVGKRRKTPRTAFLVPDRHLSHEDFGRVLLDAGLEIILGNEANSVAICTTAKQYYEAIFGEDETKPKRNRGGKKKDNDHSEILLSLGEKEQKNQEDEEDSFLSYNADDDANTVLLSVSTSAEAKPPDPSFN